MPINFNDDRNRLSYVGRSADNSWTEAISQLIDPDGLTIADIGCGGGIYSSAWRALGAKKVIGIDGSQTMIAAATEACEGLNHVSFHVGDAANTGLSDAATDVVFARALIHHLPDLRPFLHEAKRILKPGGILLIQDRTPDDVTIAPSSEHIRGYFFTCYPELLKVEMKRRPVAMAVVKEIEEAGFLKAHHSSFWETRRTYATRDSLASDIRQRTGRSILHELSDEQIEQLVAYINARLPDVGEIVEKDRWTLWSGLKPSL